MRSTRATTSLRVAAVTALALLASSCGIGGAQDLPLPGGADVGQHPYTLSANFTDVLDLVPQSSVKVADVAVGRVAAITLNPDGRSARVRMTLNDDVKLPVGTTARLQQTSLLGEKYVALVRPDDAEGAAPGLAASARATVPASTTGYLEDGDVLPLDKTSQAVGVEQVLGALSALLSGGGLGQFQEISRELQQISAGRTDEIRAFLDQARVFVADLDQRRDSITHAIDGLARLSATLETQRPQITKALDDLSPGLQVLADQRGQLVKLLQALDRLSTVSVDTLRRAQDDIVADFKQLDPILRQLARSGDDLPDALQILFTYPFPDSVLGAINGDYINVFATLALSTPGGPWLQQSTFARSSGKKPEEIASTSSLDPPMLLPSTDSAIPGSPLPTVPSQAAGSSAASPTPSSGPSTSSSASPSTSPSPGSSSGSSSGTSSGTSSAGAEPSSASSPTPSVTSKRKGGKGR